NMTAQLQPLDSGIIQTFKAYYYGQFLQLAILKDDENMTANPFKISQLEAMKMAKLAWNDITLSTIHNCWKYVGL
ncbi:CENP-B protein, partial [Tuber magnatum]